MSTPMTDAFISAAAAGLISNDQAAQAQPAAAPAAEAAARVMAAVAQGRPLDLPPEVAFADPDRSSAWHGGLSSIHVTLRAMQVLQLLDGLPLSQVAEVLETATTLARQLGVNSVTSPLFQQATAELQDVLAQEISRPPASSPRW